MKCNGIRGAMLFSVDCDDYKNVCKKDSNIPPLAVTINKEVLNDDWSICQSQEINRKNNLTDRYSSNSGLKSNQYKAAKYPFVKPEAAKQHAALVGK